MPERGIEVLDVTNISAAHTTKYGDARISFDVIARVKDYVECLGNVSIRAHTDFICKLYPGSGNVYWGEFTFYRWDFSCYNEVLTLDKTVRFNVTYDNTGGGKPLIWLTSGRPAYGDESGWRFFKVVLTSDDIPVTPRTIVVHWYWDAEKWKTTAIKVYVDGKLFKELSEQQIYSADIEVIDIDTDKNNYNMGEPVMIYITVGNFGNVAGGKTIKIYANEKYTGYYIDVYLIPGETKTIEKKIWTTSIGSGEIELCAQ